MLSGLPACGKTELDVAYAHAMATERPDLVGLSEMDRYGAVVFLALDSERAEEFKMRGEAFRKYHGLQPRLDFKYGRIYTSLTTAVPGEVSSNRQELEVGRG